MDDKSRILQRDYDCLIALGRRLEHERETAREQAEQLRVTEEMIAGMEAGYPKDRVRFIEELADKRGVYWCSQCQSTVPQAEAVLFYFGGVLRFADRQPGRPEGFDKLVALHPDCAESYKLWVLETYQNVMIRLIRVAKRGFEYDDEAGRWEEFRLEVPDRRYPPADTPTITLNELLQIPEEVHFPLALQELGAEEE